MYKEIFLAKKNPKKRGFSIVLAMVIITFLLIIATGVFDLYMREYKINTAYVHSLKGTVAAQGALEYSLLKIKNHREGFSDSIADGNEKNLLVKNERKITSEDVTIQYSTKTSGLVYTGVLSGSGFEVIPLFIDVGERLQSETNKNPNINTTHIQPVTSFLLQSDREIVMNMIGNDGNGKTFGMTATGTSFGTLSTATIRSAQLKTLIGKGFSFVEKGFDSFLQEYNNSNENQSYILLFNPSSQNISYRIEASTPFAFPRSEIVATAAIQGTQQHISFKQNESSQFESLQFSVFH